MGKNNAAEDMFYAELERRLREMNPRGKHTRLLKLLKTYLTPLGYWRSRPRIDKDTPTN